MRLKDKVIIVTGTTSGIGLACAKRFAKEGAKVVMCARSEEKGKDQEKELLNLGYEVMFIKCDVSKKAEVDNVVNKTIDKYKKIDGVLNNAGINHSASFFDTTEEDWDRVMSVDLKGTFLMSQAVAREMVREGNGGSIVNISSVTAQIALSDQVPYCSAKGGVNQLTRAMAVALGQNNIIVNSIGPGPIMTELMERVVANKEKDEELIRRMPLGRKGSPEEIAGVAVFLMTEDASFITGQCIYADGGRMIQSFPRHMEK